MSDIRDILELEQGASVPSKEAIVGGNKVMIAPQLTYKRFWFWGLITSTSIILCIEEL